jgi:hypothetical protein
LLQLCTHAASLQAATATYNRVRGEIRFGEHGTEQSAAANGVGMASNNSLEPTPVSKAPYINVGCGAAQLNRSAASSFRSAHNNRR